MILCSLQNDPLEQRGFPLIVTIDAFLMGTQQIRDDIEKDMNCRNSTSKRKDIGLDNNSKTRKKREELSISATKSIKKEEVEIVVKFN